MKECKQTRLVYNETHDMIVQRTHVLWCMVTSVWSGSGRVVVIVHVLCAPHVTCWW